MVSTSDWGPGFDSRLYSRNFSGSIGSGTGPPSLVRRTGFLLDMTSSEIRLRKLKLRLRDKLFTNHKAPCTAICQQPLQSILALRGFSTTDLFIYRLIVIILILFSQYCLEFDRGEHNIFKVTNIYRPYIRYILRKGLDLLPHSFLLSSKLRYVLQEALWLAKHLFLNLNFSFLNRISLLLIPNRYPIVLMRLGGPRSRTYTSRKISRV